MSKKNYTMSLEEKTIEDVRVYAKKNDRSVSWVTNTALKAGLKKLEEG